MKKKGDRRRWKRAAVVTVISVIGLSGLLSCGAEKRDEDGKTEAAEEESASAQSAEVQEQAVSAVSEEASAESKTGEGERQYREDKNGNLRWQSETSEEEQETAEIPYADQKDLIEKGGVTEQELKNVDADDFIRTYGLTEYNISEYDVRYLLKRYKKSREEKETPDYSWIPLSVDPDREWRADDTDSIEVVGVRLRESGREESFLFDFSGGKGYYGDNMDLFAAPVDEWLDWYLLEEKDRSDIRAAVRSADITDWPHDEEDRYRKENTGWSLYFELTDGEVIRYSGCPEERAYVKKFETLVDSFRKIFGIGQ